MKEESQTARKGDEVKNDKISGPCPFGDANWLSKATFRWLSPLFIFGRRFPLTEDTLYDVLPQDESQELADRLESVWETEIQTSRRKSKAPNLFKTVLLTFKKECFVYGIFLFLSEAIRLLQPYLIGQLISYFQPKSTLSTTEVYIIGAVLGISGLAQLLINPWYFFSAHYLALRMKVALGSTIYRKILRLSSSALYQTTSGKIINHLSTDLESFTFATETFHFIWAAPLEIVLIVTLLYFNIGVAAFFTLPVMLIIVPTQALLGRAFGRLRIKIAARTDKRIHLMSEIIAGMRVIKMYCWEEPFSRIIAKLRRSEIKEILAASLFKAINISLYYGGTKILMVTCFGVVWLLSTSLTAAQVFSTIGWMESLRLTVFLFLIFAIETNTRLWFSLKRIQEFLLLEDKPQKQEIGSSLIFRQYSQEEDISIKVNIKHAPWIDKASTSNINSSGKKPEEFPLMEADSSKFQLKNISFNIKQGDLVAVVGPVGAGKSSLLMCFLGELPVIEGNIVINGSTGFSSQQPWVVSGSVRENILFGSTYKKERYQQVLNVCSLNLDIESMKSGDQTLVGERGLLLSGGQKARITLARTIYKESDCYFLDDPLGAVDTEVGRQLFNRCVCGFLRNKTRVLVTHQLQYLKSVDRIFVIKNGTVVDSGTYEELISKGENFTEILQQEEQEEETIYEEKDNIDDKLHMEEEKLEEETSQVGRVGWKVYWQYASSVYPHLTLPLLLLLVLCTESSFVFADWHLAKWAEVKDRIYHSSDEMDVLIPRNTSLIYNTPKNFTGYNVTSFVNASSNFQKEKDKLILTYMIATAVYIFLAIVLTISFFTTSVIASKNLHNRIFLKVLYAKTRFFDSNPVGRILNRFAKDVGLMDDMIPRVLYAVFEIAFRLMALVIATCVINPLLLLPLCPLFIFIVFVRNYAVTTTRQLKRIEALSQSPVYSHVSDTLFGLQTIRALDLTTSFVTKFDKYQDHHTTANFLFLCSFRWFSIRTMLAVAVYLIFIIFTSLILKDVIGLTGGLFGLSLNYIILLADPFEFFMRLTAETETYMTSVERVTDYIHLDQENHEPVESMTLPDNWPAHGCIQFQNVFLKYTEESAYALKNLNFTINSSEKVGIVGRTGAGKSSVLATLLRLAEPTGCIFIDGIDILKIGLTELRKKIAVIPQDPVLFSGTFRRNLDPFEEYEDETLWSVVEQVELKEKLQSMTEGFYTEMLEGGRNLSVGERQLVCLARALLHTAKVLILDEATANVDQATDELIQRTIRNRFSNCTVLTVAHRLHTVMDSDRIMVLDQGEVKEFDTPFKLLQNTDGILTKLVNQTGHAQASKLKAISKSYNRDIPK